MRWIKAIEHAGKNRCARLVACALALALAGGAFAAPGAAFADVRKADVVYGQTVDARGLAVSQCPNVDADYAFLMDADGTTYYERDATDSTQIASLTKIMTAVVALDAVAQGAVSLDTTLSVSAAAAEVGESSAGLAEGDTMPLDAALKALLVPSGNDAAVAIAETVGAVLPAAPSGSAQDAFVAAMNAKAAELGCVNTVYENPHGLDDGSFKGDQHSCAADMAKIAQYAMKNETFRAIVAGGNTSIVVMRAGARTTINLETTDELIGVYPYAIGIKTGFTALAGPSFAGAAQKDGQELYAIVIHSSSEAQRFTDAQTLFDWAYQHEQVYPLAHSSQTVPATTDGATDPVPVIAEVPHSQWIDKTVKATLADPAATVRVFDLNGNVSQSLEFDEVKGDVKVGDKVGTITFKQRNAVIATQDLVACEDVKAPDFFQSIGIWWDRLLRGLSGQPQVASSVTVNDTPLINDKNTSGT